MCIRFNETDVTDSAAASSKQNTNELLPSQYAKVVFTQHYTGKIFV